MVVKVVELCNFCDICNTLLPTPNTDPVICPCCGDNKRYKDFTAHKLETKTVGEARPEHPWLLTLKKELEETRRKENSGEQSLSGDSVDMTSNKGEKKRAVVDEDCPKCGHNKASFYTLQLRSVDEGQTVFYTCLNCENHWSQNN